MLVERDVVDEDRKDALLRLRRAHLFYPAATQFQADVQVGSSLQSFVFLRVHTRARAHTHTHEYMHLTNAPVCYPMHNYIHACLYMLIPGIRYALFFSLSIPLTTVQ